MSIVKKVKLNLVERNLENVILLCSKIKASQEELKCLEDRMSYNQNEFSSGDMSQSIYETNKRNSEREKRKLESEISLNVKKSLKKLQSIENILKEANI